MLEVAMIRLCHVNDAMPEVVPSVAVDGGWVFALRGQGVLCCLKLVRRLSPPLFRFVEFRKAKRKRANESLSLLLVDNANAARLFFLLVWCRRRQLTRSRLGSWDASSESEG
ncbi:hypothetical protein HPP92_001224 [Vanilla planifolia]|uniref:Uncharacterized protein n=1 Tax=Vanilla planifolia TaxID=51239 RepID=A0A835SCJ9_VANPL|nr:hypothetical protein HPP92_001224 [Vanilla planifolia]